MSAAEFTPIGAVLAGVIARASATQEHNPADYLSDGLIYCGKCNTPKQCRIQLGGGAEKIVPCMCKCREDKLKAEMLAKRQQEEMARIEELKSKSLMDEQFKAQTFANYRTTKDNERTARLCKRYADKFSEMIERNQGLLFYGGVGTGKTYSAACIANELLNRKIPVVMTSFVKLLESTQNGDEEALIHKLNQAKLLIVDDLGAERSTDYALEKVYNIVDSRYRAKLPMILTTNLELAEMQRTADIRYSRIYDRIFETCYPVRFTGASFRKVEAKRRFDEMKALLEEE